MSLSIVVMAMIVIRGWEYAFPRLLFAHDHGGAIDLKLRFEEINHWFAGNQVYGKIGAPTYPPGSYVLLWPFLGWMDFTSARWFWSVTTIGALLWLIIIIVRESRADKSLERLFLILMITSMTSTNVTIGNGQLGIHVLPMLLCGLLMFHRGQNSSFIILFGSVLILFCLVKPSISIPFSLILFRNREGLLQVVFIVIIYSFFTFFAASFQEIGLLKLVENWLLIAKREGINAKFGYANLHQWMAAIGLGDWITHASLSMLGLLCWLLYRYRDKDIWLLMGITAIISRIWTYHALYDDILILIPMITLFRITKQGADDKEEGIKAGILLAICWFSVLAPSRLLNSPPPWDLLFKTVQPSVWMAVLIFHLKHLNRISLKS